MSTYQYIDRAEQLLECCEVLNNSAWLAVDTEFERVNTYYPKLCLVQIANADSTYVIDPLQLDDIQPMLDLLYNTAITKVLHSAHQDLEIFLNLAGSVPQPVFDTQLAAPLFGFNKGMGYGKLIHEALGVELDKTQARTDWTRRPLKETQLRYAADDVIYLGKVYERFLEQDMQDKAEQLQAMFAGLYDVATYYPDPARMWKKIFAVRRLKGKSQEAAKRLAAWRERVAREDNLPRKWVLADQALVEIAKRFPVSKEEFTTINQVSNKMASRFTEEWLAILEDLR